ncbi:DedA family protein [Pseudomonas sp. RIT288]|uniref:DedA family protein n=1 Tax=Pseudomonas sp. RIT288 TaxID=1470589 RepID=UPI00044BE3AC|nr:DedA family protein [Pseudomonas sp. RIT288]EZP34178.1 membrane protein [Pseudomonas sp. RIT288]
MLQQFLHDFGYFALFLGTFFEGETILVLAGFLAFRGYMDINLVVVVAFFGSYAGDQLWYFLGRKHGRKLLARKPRWQMMGDRALEHIRKHPDIWVLSFRFVYGLRTVMPVAIGLSGYPPGRYLLLNGIGAAIWATALAAAAYHFGAVLEGMLGSIKKYELWVLGALLVLGVGLWLRRRFKNARLAKQVYADEQAAIAARLLQAEQGKPTEPKTPAE